MPGIDISIIIPTYNRLWCLPEAVESCRNNDCSVEIIVVDDGSTDGTAEWLLTQLDVIVLSQPHIGKCWAVNKAFNIAKGKYIRFLDSDDAIEKNANDRQFKLAEINKADIVVSGYKSFDSNGKILSEQRWIVCDDFVAQQLGECDSSHYSAYLFKKEFISDIPHRPDFALRDDRLFVLEAALKAPAVAIDTETAFLHRTNHNDRLQFNNGLKLQVQNFQHVNLYKYILQQLQMEKHLTQRRIDAACNILWPLAHWIAIDFLKEATDLINWMYELNPDFKPPQNGSLGWLYKNIGFKKTEKILKWRRRIVNAFR